LPNSFINHERHHVRYSGVGSHAVLTHLTRSTLWRT
jgi:hypothetical protein